MGFMITTRLDTTSWKKTEQTMVGMSCHVEATQFFWVLAAVLEKWVGGRSVTSPMLKSFHISHLSLYLIILFQ